jgi:hypothetical protein
MVVVLGVLALMLGIGAAIHSAVVAETSLRGAHARGTNGFYAAEAGINHGMGDYRNIFLSYNVPSGSDFDPHTFMLGGRTVRYQLALVPPSPGKPNPSQVTIPAGSQFAGLNSTQYRYTVTSNSELTAGDTEVSIGSQFNIDYVPLFQFLAFYQGDLEILPGPNMTLTGPVHTNGSLYLNSNTTCSGSPCVGGLAIRDAQPQIPTVSVTAVGSVYRGRKDSSACLGTVQIAKLVDTNFDGALDLLAMPCSGVQSSSQLSSWLGAIKAGQPTVQVPSPGVLARGSGEFWLKADLRLALDVSAPDSSGLYRIVVLDAAGNVDVAANARLQAFMLAKPGRIFYTDAPLPGKQDPTTDCTNPTGGKYCHWDSYVPPFPSQNAVYACPGGDLFAFSGCAATVVNESLAGGDVTARRGGFYNNREHAWVYMLNVNAHDLLAWNRAQASANRLFDPDDATDGGIVLFLTVVGSGSTGPIPSPRYGVRVFGSSDLDFPAGVADPTGLTVVSDQGFYLEGHYNVGTVPRPKQPAAVMADTVNVLSSNWSGGSTGWTGVASCRNDCQSRQTLSARPAAATSIYAAFLGGVDVTTSGNYNGGFENYPRFQETWSGLTLFYRGSFVSLGTPTRANGPWCGTGGSSASGCNIYNPPGTRDWNYDVAFQQVENLPPLTPRVVSVQQILFTENFR